MTTNYYYYVVFFDGSGYKDTILNSSQFAGCKFIDKDKFMVAQISDWEGLILRVHANKRELEEHLRKHPIDLCQTVKERFSTFPTNAKPIAKDNQDSMVHTAEQTTLKPEPKVTKMEARVNKNAKPTVQKKKEVSKIKISKKKTSKRKLKMSEIDTQVDNTAQLTTQDHENPKAEALNKQETLKCQLPMTELNILVNENDIRPKSKLYSTHRIETVSKRKLDTSDEKLHADKSIKKSRVSGDNEIVEGAKKDAEAQNMTDDSDDMSIYKRYKVYKRRSPNPDCGADKKTPEKEAWQQNLSSIPECIDKPTSDELLLQSRSKSTEGVTNLNHKSQIESSDVTFANEETSKNEIETIPETDHDFNEKIEIQLQTLPQIDRVVYAMSEPRNKVFSDEQISRQLYEEKFFKLSENYIKLKKRCRKLYHSNKLLYEFISHQFRLSGKILQRNDMPSSPLYIPGLTSKSSDDDTSDDMPVWI